jgi:hypothetical protein
VILKVLTPLVRAATRSAPEVVFVPLNDGPPAVQLVASSLRQLKSTDAPGKARSALTCNVTFGAGSAITVRR